MGYNNFNLSIYFTAQYLNSLRDANQLEDDFKPIEKYVKCSKVYLETFRADLWVDNERMQWIKKFFEQKGIQAAGGITTVTGSGLSGFAAFCYSRQDSWQKLKEIVRLTASMFDEFILDDFFFTNCKCESCVNAKGDRSWSDFRTSLLKDVSEEVVREAKGINPNVKVVIKYPNWYDHYQDTGYNLKDQPAIFDGVYTGTETRDPRYTQQHLQSYLSYFLMRYMENVAPGRNGGGWFDNFDCLHNLGHYLEQINLTAFSKAREITLFTMQSIKDSIFLPMVGYALEKLDEVVGNLGNPIGVACYKPYHSSGEDHLYDYLGMLGIPFEPAPVFPVESNVAFLTASASTDADIIEKIKLQLLNGKKVIITSGLLEKLQKVQGEKVSDLISARITNKKALVNLFGCRARGCAFKNYYRSGREILVPVIDYSTNDCWPVAVAFSGNNNFPVILETQYGKGLLYVITIPDNYADIYDYPKELLYMLRALAMDGIPVKMDGDSRIALFIYDNDTFVLESFLPYNSSVCIEVEKPNVCLKNIVSGQEIKGVNMDGKTVFDVNIPPTVYIAYKII